MSLILQKIFCLGLSSSDSYQREHDKQKKQPSSHQYLTTHLRLMNILSSVCTNISALAKITDRVTLHTVINGAVLTPSPDKHS